MLDARRFRVLALLYFVSGAAGLADEVAFFKYLSFVFGATAYASSAVLVAFMGGLAVGAAAMARDARVRRACACGAVVVVGARGVAIRARERGGALADDRDGRDVAARRARR